MSLRVDTEQLIYQAVEAKLLKLAEHYERRTEHECGRGSQRSPPRARVADGVEPVRADNTGAGARTAWIMTTGCMSGQMVSTAA